MHSILLVPAFAALCLGVAVPQPQGIASVTVNIVDVKRQVLGSPTRSVGGSPGHIPTPTRLTTSIAIPSTSAHCAASCASGYSPVDNGSCNCTPIHPITITSTKLTFTTSSYCTVSCISGYFPVGDGSCKCTPAYTPIIISTISGTSTSAYCAASCASGFSPVGDGSCNCTPMYTPTSVPITSVTSTSAYCAASCASGYSPVDDGSCNCTPIHTSTTRRTSTGKGTTRSPTITTKTVTPTSSYCAISCISGYLPVGDGSCNCTPIYTSTTRSTSTGKGTTRSPTITTKIVTPTSSYCAISCISGYLPVGDGSCNCTPIYAPTTRITSTGKGTTRLPTGTLSVPK